jgi:hypothetical protein
MSWQKNTKEVITGLRTVSHTLNVALKERTRHVQVGYGAFLDVENLATLCKKAADLLESVEERERKVETRKERPLAVGLGPQVRKAIRYYGLEDKDADGVAACVSETVLDILDREGYFAPPVDLKERALKAHARCDFASPEDRDAVLEALKSLPSQQSNDN